MNIFKKSLSHELISTAGGVFVILIGIIIAQRAGNLIRLAAKGILPNDAINTLLGFSMIRYMPMILSLTIFLAVLLTLTRWHRDSEMVVWFSSGLGINKWVKPILSFAVPIIVVISLLSFLVMPWAIEKVEDYRVQLKSRDDLSSISPGVFKESSSGERVYFIESFDELGNVVKNIFVQTVQHQKTGVIVASEGSRIKEKNGDDFLVMKKGRRYEAKPNSAGVSTTEFERYGIRVETKEVAREPNTANAKSTQELLDTNASATSSRAPTVSNAKPSGITIGTSFIECTAMSARPSAIATSNSLINNPLPPICESGLSRIWSPFVVMPIISTAKLG